MAYNACKSRRHGDDPSGGTFPQLIEEATIDPQQGIDSLAIVDLVDTTLAQQQRISTSLVPPPSTSQPPSQILPLQQPFHLQAPSPPPDLTRQVVMPT